LQYGSGQGHPKLREQICEVMALEGIRANPDDVLVTTGSQQALDLISRIFIDPGDAERLGRADFRDVIAESIVIAIQRLYLASEDDAKTGMLRLSDLRKAGLRSN